jgi:dehydrogenase/reductase SDR family protein 4
VQANVDEAVAKLKSKGIDAYGIVCHVSNAQHRRNLVEKTVQVTHPTSFWFKAH